MRCLGMQSAGSDAFKTTGRCFSVAAGRIAYTYALKGAPQLSLLCGFVIQSQDLSVRCQHTGPALAVDTACSSSLTAMQLTADLLRRRACTRGLVAAALLTLEPSTVGALAASAMLAPDGRCKTLDVGADGYALHQALTLQVLPSV